MAMKNGGVAGDGGLLLRFLLGANGQVLEPLLTRKRPFRASSAERPYGPAGECSPISAPLYKRPRRFRDGLDGVFSSLPSSSRQIIGG